MFSQSVQVLHASNFEEFSGPLQRESDVSGQELEEQKELSKVSGWLEFFPSNRDRVKENGSTLLKKLQCFSTILRQRKFFSLP